MAHICQRLKERDELIGTLQNRIAALETTLTGIHGAAELIQASVAANQGLLVEADEARLSFILEESAPFQGEPFNGELPAAVQDVLTLLGG